MITYIKCNSRRYYKQKENQITTKSSINSNHIILLLLGSVLIAALVITQIIKPNKETTDKMAQIFFQIYTLNEQKKTNAKYIEENKKLIEKYNNLTDDEKKDIQSSYLENLENSIKNIEQMDKGINKKIKELEAEQNNFIPNIKISKLNDEKSYHDTCDSLLKSFEQLKKENEARKKTNLETINKVDYLKNLIKSKKKEEKTFNMKTSDKFDEYIKQNEESIKNITTIKTAITKIFKDIKDNKKNITQNDIYKIKENYLIEQIVLYNEVLFYYQQILDFENEKKLNLQEFKKHSKYKDYDYELNSWDDFSKIGKTYDSLKSAYNNKINNYHLYITTLLTNPIKHICSIIAEINENTKNNPELIKSINIYLWFIKYVYQRNKENQYDFAYFFSKYVYYNTDIMKYKHTINLLKISDNINKYLEEQELHIKSKLEYEKKQILHTHNMSQGQYNYLNVETITKKLFDKIQEMIKNPEKKETKSTVAVDTKKKS